VLFRKEGYSPLFLNASSVKLISGFQTLLQVTTSCKHDYNSLIPFSSVVVTEGHEQLIPFPRSYPQSVVSNFHIVLDDANACLPITSEFTVRRPWRASS
jgi:hypothetical protein